MIKGRVEIIEEFIEDWSENTGCNYCEIRHHCEIRHSVDDNEIKDYCRKFLTELFLPEDKNIVPKKYTSPYIEGEEILIDELSKDKE